MLLYGASGHAKVICSCLESIRVPIEAIFDDNPILKKLDEYDIIGLYSKDIFTSSSIIISIGNNRVRKKITFYVQHNFGQVAHASSLIDSSVVMGSGSVLFQNAIVQRGTHLGKHLIVNTNASIDHDCYIEDFVHISPNACLCGSVFVGEGSHIGANATIIQNIRIGKWATIGAGTVVLKDVPDYAIVVGNPGRIIGYNEYYKQ